MDSCCWRHDGSTHSTGEPVMSCPFDLYGANQIGVFPETACQLPQPRLYLAVFFYNESTGRTSPAGILRHHADEPTAIPDQLVLRLPAKLERSLVGEGAVQSGLGPDLLTSCLASSRCRSGHIPYRYIVGTHYRVVFAASGRGVTKRVVTGVGNTLMQPGYFLLLLFPVGGEFFLPSQTQLFLGKFLFHLFETVERFQERTFREDGKPGNDQVDPHGRDGWMYWFDTFPLGLNRDRPMIPQPRHGDISGVLSISWLLINRTHPILAGKTRSLSSLKPCGYRKGSMPWPFFLNQGNRCTFFLSNAS